MAKKPDLAASLAEVSGSTRRKPEPVAPSHELQTGQEPSREGYRSHHRPFPNTGPQPAQNYGD